MHSLVENVLKEETRKQMYLKTTNKKSEKI
jgi:hypothetical protein